MLVFTGNNHNETCSLCSFTLFVPFFFPLPLQSSICPPDTSTVPCLFCNLSLPCYPLPSHLLSALSRGTGVVCALPVLSQRAAGSGEGSLRTGLCSGCRPPICPPMRASPCTHSTPTPPGRAGPGDTKVHKLNTPYNFSIFSSMKNTFILD